MVLALPLWLISSYQGDIHWLTQFWKYSNLFLQVDRSWIQHTIERNFLKLFQCGATAENHWATETRVTWEPYGSWDKANSKVYVKPGRGREGVEGDRRGGKEKSNERNYLREAMQNKVPSQLG